MHDQLLASSEVVLCSM